MFKASLSSYLAASWRSAWSGGLKEVKRSLGGDTAGYTTGHFIQYWLVFNLGEKWYHKYKHYIDIKRALWFIWLVLPHSFLSPSLHQRNTLITQSVWPPSCQGTKVEWNKPGHLLFPFMEKEQKKADMANNKTI